MSLRSRHGNARNYGSGPVVETMPFDELPPGVQGAEQVEAGGERRADGTLTPGSSTTQSKGGRALKSKTALGSKFELGGLAEAEEFVPYKRKARAYAKAQCRHLARTVGGGELGPGPAAMVLTAALELGAGRYLYDQAAATGDAKLFALATRILDAARSNLAQAHEYAAKEAQARPRGLDPISALQAEAHARAALRRENEANKGEQPDSDEQKDDQ